MSGSSPGSRAPRFSRSCWRWRQTFSFSFAIAGADLLLALFSGALVEMASLMVYQRSPSTAATAATTTAAAATTATCRRAAAKAATTPPPPAIAHAPR